MGVSLAGLTLVEILNGVGTPGAKVKEKHPFIIRLF